jgi:hypothetical protein
VGQDLQELVAAYQHAERRLRGTLLGDGVYSSGAVHGEEQRLLVSSQLRTLRSSFDALVELAESAAGRVLEDALDGELRGRARRAARRPTKPKP